MACSPAGTAVRSTSSPASAVPVIVLPFQVKLGVPAVSAAATRRPWRRRASATETVARSISGTW
jgi:hypothetical protein